MVFAALVLLARTRGRTEIAAIRRGRTTVAVAQLTASRRVKQLLLRQHYATALGTQLEHILVVNAQQIVIYVLDRNALRVRNVPHTFESRPCIQTGLRLDQLRTRSRRILNHIRQHLAVETAVDVQRLFKYFRTVSESRQIRSQIDGHMVLVPRIAQDVVHQQVLAVAFGAETVRRVVVRVAAKHHHQTGRDEIGRMQETARRRSGEQRPRSRARLKAVHPTTDHLMALRLRHNAAVHVNLLRQRIVAGAVPIAALHRKPNSRHNLPFARRKRILLHRIQVAKDRRMPENGKHFLRIRLLGVVPRRHQRRRVSRRLERTAHLVRGIARVHLDGDILPRLGRHIKRPHLVAHALVLDHTAVHDNLVAVHDGGRTESRLRRVGTARRCVHRLPNVAIKVVGEEQIGLAVRLAADNVQRVTPHGRSVRSGAGQ